MNVTLLYFDDCPSWQVTDQHLRTIEAELGFTVDRVEITTPEAAEQPSSGDHPASTSTASTSSPTQKRPSG